MRGNGRGPEGKGPMTGRGLGNCIRAGVEEVQEGRGSYFEQGPGRGFRGGPGRGGPGMGRGRGGRTARGTGFGRRGESR